MRVVLPFFSILLGTGVIACDEISERLLPVSLPPCESEQVIAGWKVSSDLVEPQSGDLLIDKWEVERSFSSFFGLRITFDTSYSQTPYLKIWHDYKSGEFTMRLPDETRLSARLNASSAVTTAQLRPIDVETLTRQPVRIEHTSHDGKWRVYQTDGLPEAIETAKADLALAKERLNNNECSI